MELSIALAIDNIEDRRKTRELSHGDPRTHREMTREQPSRPRRGRSNWPQVPAGSNVDQRSGAGW